jgi:hypothetical protein
MVRLMPRMTAGWKRGMQLGVTSKLVCAFILTNGAVVIGMIVFLHWNFGRGFLDYLSQTEVRQLDVIGGALAARVRMPRCAPFGRVTASWAGCA